MRVAPLLLVAIMLIWAGLALGGNTIAASAKFQVDDLTLGQLLQVGRAQFAWLGIAEMVCAGLVVILAALATGRVRMWALAAVMLLGLQQFGLQPMLEARTTLIISGTPAPHSALHLVFILVEAAKTVLLLTGGIGHLVAIHRDLGG